MIALYSINLHIMGKPTYPYFAWIQFIQLLVACFIHQMWSAAIVGVIVAVVVCLLLFWFFGTEIGTALRATGVNPQMIRAQGVNTNVLDRSWPINFQWFRWYVWCAYRSIPRLCRRRHGHWYHHLSVWHPLLSVRLYSVQNPLFVASLL